MKKIIAISTILIGINYAVNAQPGSTTGGFDDEPVDVPIDAGIVILIGAGVVYGAKKHFKKNKI